ncbi:MAG: hypothetical protein J6B29_03925 [Clostridia bacterium]|nr:hypothetical protein [Clostridia bacterium]
MAQWKDRELEQTHLWKLYQQGIEYQSLTGMRASIPKFVDFYEGRQWPAPTESTKNLPRPVVNIVKMICRSKKSSILSTPVRLVYKSFTPGTNVEKFNSFAQSVQKEIGQDMIDREAIDDGVKKGSYFYHYYWDKDAITISGRIEGGVRCELIDPLNIFFSNPSLTNEQEQSWILISSSKELDKIIEMCDKDTDKSLIQEDGDEDNGAKHLSAPTATLLTRYFRINGEVYCERATKNAIVNKPFPITPNHTAMERFLAFGEKSDNEQGSDSQATEQQIYKKSSSIFTKKPLKATLYPIVCGYYERKEGSIYGISEVEGIIPNQKAINFNLAMSLLNAQQCAWGKFIALPNALKGQKISNTPGQVLIDHSGTGDGIKRMKEEYISEAPIALSKSLTEMTRVFTGATEIISSEALSSSMSGVAIAQLQAQAEVPLEDLRAGFWEAKRKQGLILAQFFKLYYYEREFIKKTKDNAGEDKEEIDTFSSSEYESSVFDVIVEPVGGTKASVASDISMLDNCLKNGSISLETYIKAYPDSAINNKQEILEQIKAEKSSEIIQLRKELERYKNSKTADPVSIV